MIGSRRKFLQRSSAVLLATTTAPIGAQVTNPPAGAPPAFNTGPAIGPKVSSSTFEEAEKLAQVKLTEPQRAMAADNWRTSMAPLYERRTGPRKVVLEPALAPGSQWNPLLPGLTVTPTQDRFVRAKFHSTPLPSDEESVAYTPLTQLAQWIEERQLSSERLTKIYLERLERFDPKLRCVITLVRDRAIAQARKADAEIAAGHYRGPLHGIPWGAKDLLDTAGIPTTYGAEFFRNRIPAKKVQPLLDVSIRLAQYW
jgi:hypothetical protein